MVITTLARDAGRKGGGDHHPRPRLRRRRFGDGAIDAPSAALLALDAASGATRWHRVVTDAYATSVTVGGAAHVMATFAVRPGGRGSRRQSVGVGGTTAFRPGVGFYAAASGRHLGSSFDS